MLALSVAIYFLIPSLVVSRSHSLCWPFEGLFWYYSEWNLLPKQAFVEDERYAHISKEMQAEIISSVSEKITSQYDVLARDMVSMVSCLRVNRMHVYSEYDYFRCNRYSTVLNRRPELRWVLMHLEPE